MAISLLSPEHEEALRSVVRVTDASTAYAENNNYYIYFYYVASGHTGDPEDEPHVKFKAYLNAFEDQFSSAWRDEDIYGRMDSISTFQGTRRQINFGFDVVAGDISEARDNYNNSKTLLSYLYPVYADMEGGDFRATSIKAPPLLKIRFANFISENNGLGEEELVGKLSGLNYKPVLDMGFFEEEGNLYPKVNNFSCNFTVFHTRHLGRVQDSDDGPTAGSGGRGTGAGGGAGDGGVSGPHGASAEENERANRDMENWAAEGQTRQQQGQTSNEQQREQQQTAVAEEDVLTTTTHTESVWINDSEQGGWHVETTKEVTQNQEGVVVEVNTERNQTYESQSEHGGHSADMPPLFRGPNPEAL